MKARGIFAGIQRVKQIFLLTLHEPPPSGAEAAKATRALHRMASVGTVPLLAEFRRELMRRLSYFNDENQV